MTNVVVRPKGPQPVLDDLVSTPATNGMANGDVEHQERPNSAPRTNGVTAPTVGLVRSSTHHLSVQQNGDPVRSRSASPNDRPKLLRAKSDFGPRWEDHANHDDTDSKASSDAEWGIRHGFDTQLASEDYNHLLTEVSP